MKGEARLRKPADFARLHRQGRHLSHSLLMVKSLPNGLACSRQGIVVSKKLGPAVVRNRVKRRLREILRQMMIKPGRDIVIIARPAAALAGFGDLQHAVAGLLEKSGLTETDEISGHGVN